MRGLRIGHSVVPRIGAHGKDFDVDAQGTSPSTVTLDTQASGSSIIAATFGEFTRYSVGADSKGNTLSLLETSGYNGGLWPGFGLELYGKADASGGASHAVSITKLGGFEIQETTLIVAEVIGGRTIQDTSVVTRAAAGAGVPYTSAAVTVTGPAVLLAVWGGDASGNVSSMDVSPENGWTVIESDLRVSTAYIQASMAYKRVTAAGDYTCTWTPVGNQGAILAMAAVQA